MLLTVGLGPPRGQLEAPVSRELGPEPEALEDVVVRVDTMIEELVRSPLERASEEAASSHADLDGARDGLRERPRRAQRGDQKGEADGGRHFRHFTPSRSTHETASKAKGRGDVRRVSETRQVLGNRKLQKAEPVHALREA